MRRQYRRAMGISGGALAGEAVHHQAPVDLNLDKVIRVVIGYCAIGRESKDAEGGCQALERRSLSPFSLAALSRRSLTLPSLAALSHRPLSPLSLSHRSLPSALSRRSLTALSHRPLTPFSHTRAVRMAVYI
jgi:hypothetical protein